MRTIDCIRRASAETIARQPVFQARVSPKAADVEGVCRVEHRFELRLHPAVHGPDRPAEDRPLEPFRLPMHLHRLYILAPQVGGVERLGGCVAVDEDRIVADRAGQDVRDRAEDRERVLPKQEGRAREGELARAQDLGRSDVRFRLVIDPFVVP